MRTFFIFKKMSYLSTLNMNPLYICLIFLEGKGKKWLNSYLYFPFSLKQRFLSLAGPPQIFVDLNCIYFRCESKLLQGVLMPHFAWGHPLSCLFPPYTIQFKTFFSWFTLVVLNVVSKQMRINLMDFYFVLAISAIVSSRSVRLICTEKNSHLNTYKDNQR